MTARPRISLIVARARNGVIGRDGALPWRIPADLAHFKRTTMGKPVIMGRRTWDSLGRPLPGRRNVVVSRNAEMVARGAEVVGSLAHAIELCADAEEVVVIGGAALYAQALALAQRAWVTEIDADVQGDTVMPALDPSQWREASRSAVEVSPDGLRYTFACFERGM